MGRARANALALVNWKGVFYERYRLDRHVTALEGANGAGKTTVMIAAYVVLLPDLARLRFTNVGESGATGGDKGIWGRLGEPSRPAYSVIEFELPAGERVIAGVHLERKAEPSLALTPFLISGLGEAVGLRDVLLLADGEHEAVPELAELKETVKQRGGRITVFASSKDYFSALFELGVTPLRLGTDEERNKLNEMLRTSMTGGISRALTSELRGFLFKQESGLSETLSRMRANLDACHRTRLEVAEARRLEHEVSGIFEAGRGMFGAALAATRRAVEEAEQAAEDARAARTAPDAERERVARELAELRARGATLEQRLASARAAQDRARSAHERAERALSLAERLASIEAERARAREILEAEALAADAAREARATQRAARDRAREAHDRAAHGLGHLQAGLEELHRNAHAFRHATEQLAAAREALGEPTLSADAVEERLREVQARLRALDEERARLDRDTELAGARRAERARALTALTALSPADSSESEYERARAALTRTRRLEALAARLPELAAAVDSTRELATRQVEARDRAASLGVASAPAENALAIERRLVELEVELRERSATVAARLADAERAHRAAQAAKARLAELGALANRWAALEPLLARLEHAAPDEAATDEPAPSSDSDDASGALPLGARLAKLRAERREQREALERAREARVRRCEALRRELRALESGIGALPEELVRIAGELDAELVATHYEDTGVDGAALLEARLGALSHALLVDDPVKAARALADAPREVDTLWLLPAGTSPEPELVGTGVRDVIVRDGPGIRLSRIPERATLGRSARARRIDELSAAIESEERALEEQVRERQALDAVLRDLDRALADPELLARGDPSAAIEAERRALEAAREEEARHREAAERAREREHALPATLERLRALLGVAYLLDPPDHGAELTRLEAALSQARAASAELERTRAAAHELEELVEVLRLPLTAEDEAARQARRAEVDRERDRAFRASTALAEVARHRTALGLTDAGRALAAEEALLPRLEAQLEAARRVLDAEEAKLAEAEQAWEAAIVRRQQADAEHRALEAHAARVASELEEQGGAAVSAEAVAAAKEALDAATAACAALEREDRELAAELAARAERMRHLEARVHAAESELAERERAIEPLRRACAELEEAARSAGALGDEGAVAFPHASSHELWSNADTQAELLLERLGAAPGGADTARELKELAVSRRQHSASVHLHVWLRVRAWLLGRVPVQVLEGADPLTALLHLRDHLAGLEQRLARQEADLRGASEDIARSIDVQLRRAKGQVRRLNQNLDGVRFGSITGIRVTMQRIERMDQVLTALRDGSAQTLLFQSTLPIEEALDEVFRRYAGGRSGGQRLLDYREYVELSVEIQRQGGATWEPASPARLSTGEAIGVGAALMMVILTEWERDATLFRGKRAWGSLRFLFLDEANRLSQDNLAVLFELCQNLDLQLLIAAPEVQTAHGNTTYRLVRHVTDDGREEVLVSGRRTIELERPAESFGGALGAAPAFGAPALSDLQTLFDDSEP